MQKTKIVDLYNSDLFTKDSEFETEEEKEEYYSGDFWIDADYIIKKGLSIPVVGIGSEVIINEDYLEHYDITLSKKDIKAIEKFYSEPADLKGFKELKTFLDSDIKESEKEISNSGLGLKFRGGKGYAYAWWVLIK